MEAYYADKIKDFPIEIRQIDEIKGKGVFATRDIKEGEVLIKEDPIVSCQYSYNRVCFSLTLIFLFF